MLPRFFRASQVRALIESAALFALSARVLGESAPPSTWLVFGLGLAGGVSAAWAALRASFAPKRSADWLAAGAAALSIVPTVSLATRLTEADGIPATRIALIAAGAYLVFRGSAALFETARARGARSIAWHGAAVHAAAAVRVATACAVAGAFAAVDAPWFRALLPPRPPGEVVGPILVHAASLALWLSAVAIVFAPMALVLSRRVALRSTARLRRLADVAEHFEGDHGTVVVAVSGADELAQLERSFDRLAARVATLCSDRRGWLAASARALSEPVRSLRESVDRLSGHAVENGLAPRGLKALGAVEEELARVERAIHDLTDLADARERGPRDDVPARVDVKALLRAVVDRERGPAWQSDRITLVLDDAQEGLAVQADPDRLRHALAHLVENAVRHVPEGGLVRVGVARDEGHVRIDVRRSHEAQGAGNPASQPLTLFLPIAS